MQGHRACLLNPCAYHGNYAIFLNLYQIFTHFYASFGNIWFFLNVLNQKKNMPSGKNFVKLSFGIFPEFHENFHSEFRANSVKKKA